MTPTAAPERESGDARTRQDVQLRFLEACDRGEPVGPWLAQYPQYCEELIELALSTQSAERLPAPTASDLYYTRQIMQRTLREVAGPAPVAPPGILARVRAAGLTIEALAARLDIASDLVFKLDGGYLRRDTVPRRLFEQLAAILHDTVEQIMAGVPSRPALAAGAAFYSRRRPAPASQQSFAQAVRESVHIPADARARWLAAVQEEGLDT